MATQKTTITQYIIAKNNKLVYRRLSQRDGIPLVMLMHFRGNMDFWDPALVDALAKSRPILLLDYARDANVIDILDTLKIREIDLLGFSMGGAAAQYVILAAPGLVRKLILAGTRTSLIPNTKYGPKHIFNALATSVTDEESKASLALSFFNPDEKGRKEAKAYLDCVYSPTAEERSPHVIPEQAKRQAQSFAKFSVANPDNPYERIQEF